VTSLLFSTAIFATYSLSGHVLTASTLFTSLALFNTLIAPLNSLPWVINGVVEALVSVDRLEAFLSLQQVTWQPTGSTTPDCVLHAWPIQQKLQFVLSSSLPVPAGVIRQRAPGS
jgi:ATP-binding cassette, subfamily C (CFTR/MRP), member 10